MFGIRAAELRRRHASSNPPDVVVRRVRARRDPIDQFRRHLPLYRLSVSDYVSPAAWRSDRMTRTDTKEMITAPVVPQISLYHRWLSERRGLEFASYEAMRRWSVTDL